MFKVKVKVTDETKMEFTLSEKDNVRQTVEFAKECDITPEIRIAWACAFGHNLEDDLILSATARVRKNPTVWDRLTDGTGHGDIYITVFAREWEYGNEIFQLSFFLSEAWEIGDDESNDKFRCRAYTATFKKEN